ncbi:MAG: cation diffusion facilitator family transporter, partial [Candidatus Lokiarchaeota archaeon]
KSPKYKMDQRSNVRINLKIFQNPLIINVFLFSINLVLFILKLVFSFLTNSLALQADAYDTITDTVMAFSAVIGILFTLKSPTEKYPYGYYKIENIISLIISLFLFLTAYNIIRDSILKIIAFFNGKPSLLLVTPEIVAFLIIFLVISISITLYLKIIGKKSASPIIKSEGDEKLFDNLISLSVLIGFIGAYFGLFFLDTFIGLFIAFFIIKGGYDIFLSSVKPLLDAVIDFNKRSELYDLIIKFPRVEKVKSLEVRSYGKYIFAETEILLNKDLHISNIDLLKEKLINKIKEKFPEIFKVVILTSTMEKEVHKITIPLENNNGVNSKIYDHYGEAPYFAIILFQDNQFTKLEVLTNKFKEEERRKGILVSDWLISLGIHKIYLKTELRKGPKLIFENSFIQIVQTDANNLKEIIEEEVSNS